MHLKKFLCFFFCFAATKNNLALQNPFYPKLAAVCSLRRYPADTLRMVGTVQEGEQYLAILLTPNQHIYPVAVGAVIGSEHALIIEVTKQCITLQKKEQEEAFGRQGIKTMCISVSL